MNGVRFGNVFDRIKKKRLKSQPKRTELVEQNWIYFASISDPMARYKNEFRIPIVTLHAFDVNETNVVIQTREYGYKFHLAKEIPNDTRKTITRNIVFFFSIEMY